MCARRAADGGVVGAGLPKSSGTSPRAPALIGLSPAGPPLPPTVLAVFAFPPSPAIAAGVEARRARIRLFSHFSFVCAGATPLRGA
jgi:hypothetical protein